ncbi:MAG: DUF885 domain-containing protein [Planctomycetota bacterium]|nr:MAG: DUF885 domain-containing protein [Planctomycetota bacterium]
MEQAKEKLHNLLDEAWEYGLKENPIFASFIGDYRYNDQMPEISLEIFEKHYQKDKEFLSRLKEISKEDLDGEDQLNYLIFQENLESSIREYELGSHFLPINNVAGFHISLPQLSSQLRFSTIKDYEDYISRLEKMGDFIDGQIRVMEKGVEKGYSPAKAALSGCQDAIESQIVTPEKSPFFLPFQNFPSSVPEKYHEELREKAKRAIQNSVIPAYNRLLEFLKEKYLPAAREKSGISEIPQGREFYQHRIRTYTAPGLTPEKIHEIGLQEVERIKKEMEEVIHNLSFQGSFSDFLEFLRTDPQFYAETEKDLLKEVSYILKKMDGELPRYFQRLPRIPYGIRPVPEYSAPKAPTAYYMPPAGDGSRAGFYYVNTYDLKSRPLYELETLSLHEAVPGHHLQIALQQEMDLPPFRKYAHFLAYIEGWALYAERLGRELGFYEDPYSFFGHLTYEIWRACRLVVDTGIHAMGWSRDQAIQFMTENSALSRLNIESEVDRYIAWPGQALSYKIGELKFRELRQKAEQEMGEDFSIREFHSVLLESGSVPLSVLEEKVNSYIQSKTKIKG